MEITIIGGGIGGLTLANALKSMGINFHLFERASTLEQVGAGIGLSESALQIINKIGLYNRIAAKGKLVKKTILADKHLKSIRTIPTEGDGLCIDRTSLIDILSENLSSEDYSLNKNFQSFHKKNGNIIVEFSSGEKVEANLLIACDGINSSIRNKTYPLIQKRFSGQTIWRGISNLKLPLIFQNTYFELWGENLRFGICPMDDQRYYWYAVKRAPANEREKPTRSRQLLKNLFKNYAPIISQIIESSPKIIRDDMWDLEPHNFSWYIDNVVFLGDSIHATTPNLAQGGCQAIEDAYTLACVISKYGLTKNSFKIYEKLRRGKTTYIVDKSWQFGKLAHSSNPYFVNFNTFLIKYFIPNRFFINQYNRITDLTYLNEI